MSRVRIANPLRSEETPWHRVHEDSFCLCPKRGFVLLQRMAIGLLRKLKCFAEEDGIAYSWVDFKSDDVVRNFIQHYEGVLDECCVSEIRNHKVFVLIGSTDFAALMKLPEIQQAFRFDMTIHYAPHGRQRLFGIPVCVAPWMKGMVVVPYSAIPERA